MHSISRGDGKESALTKQPKAPASPGSYLALGTSAWAELLSKMMGAKMANTLRVAANVTSPSKNAEVLTEANRIAMEAALSIAECQCQTLRETWQRLFDLGEGLLCDGMSSAAVNSQYEMVRWGAEKFLADGRQLAGIIGRLNEQSAAAAGERLAGMLEEIEDLTLNWKQ